MASRIMLKTAKNHIERGGRPVKKIRTVENNPLKITCQPMAIYFSSALLSRKFHNACMDADKNRRTRARIGMIYLKRLMAHCTRLTEKLDQSFIYFIRFVMLNPVSCLLK